MENKVNQIVMVPIDKIIPNEKNNNKHSKEQKKRAHKIFDAQGFRSPLLISNRTGKLVAGHLRLEVAKEKGVKELPCMFQDFESEEQEYQHLTADNALASWSELDLSQINTDILELGPFDIDLLGIKDFVVEPIEKFEPQSDEDEVPEVVHPITRRGDIWLLGNHRLKCGDSTMIDDVEKLMNGEKADMVFTSPPYNIGKNGFEKKGKYENDCDDKESFRDFLNEFLNSWVSHSLYQFVNLQFVSKNKRALLEWANDNKDRFVDIACCVKDSTLPAMEKNILNADFELVYIFSENGRTRHIKLGKDFRGNVSNVFKMPRNRKKVSDLHRAGFDVSFPLAFIEELLGKHGSVADPFMGTGTTLIACEKTNRKCYGMELDEKYCDVIINRWQNFTGKKAVLESTKQTYEELKQERGN